MANTAPDSGTVAELALADAHTSADPDSIPLYNWYVLGVLTATVALGTLDRAIISVILEAVRAEFVLNDAQLGFLAGLAFSITYTVLGIPAGMLIDRVNRRNLLACVAAAWSLMTACAGLSQSFVQLVIARMAVGAAEAGLPTAVSIITDYFPARRRPMAIGLYISGGTFGIGLSFALGGWVAYEWGWRVAFFVVGLPGLLVATLIWLTVREPKRGAYEGAHSVVELAPPFRETLRYLLRTPSAIHIFIGYVLSNVGIAGYLSWVASFLIRVHELNIRDAGLLVALSIGLMAGLGGVVGAYISDQLGKRSLKAVLNFSALASALLFPFGIAMSVAPTSILAVIFMMMVGLLMMSYLGPSQGILLSVVKVRMRGVTTTLLHVLGTLVGYSIGPLIAGGVSHLLGGGTAIRYAMPVVFVFCLWAAVHYWLATRTVSRDLETATR